MNKQRVLEICDLLLDSLECNLRVGIADGLCIVLDDLAEKCIIRREEFDKLITKMSNYRKSIPPIRKRVAWWWDTPCINGKIDRDVWNNTRIDFMKDFKDKVMRDDIQI